MGNNVILKDNQFYTIMPGDDLSGFDFSENIEFKPDILSNDLTNVDFSHSTLSRVNLSGSNLFSANLSRAELFGAH